MDFNHFISIPLDEFVRILVASFSIFFALLMLIKLTGLRSFSKMSAHDFAVTIAIGSLVAGVIVQKDPPFINGFIAVASLLALQTLYSKWRLARNKSILENTPLLLMRGDEILYDNLEKAKITKADLVAKLREANVLNFDEIRAVVFESTGDVSVLHGDGDFDEKLLSDVRSF